MANSLFITPEFLPLFLFFFIVAITMIQKIVFLTLNFVVQKDQDERNTLYLNLPP
jgi:hypothetical protein